MRVREFQQTRADAPDCPTSEALEPFGVLLRSGSEASSPADLDPLALKTLALEHRVVVLRGFAPLAGDALLGFARRFGPLLEWNFGYLFDLQVQAEPSNYLFTRGNVPYHWDGAFAVAVPSFQLFSCLAAPGPQAGGETLFCHTERVWAGLTAAERARFADLELEYETEKVAHYGGRISARLVSRHPRTGAATLRFAEPFNQDTAPLNPLMVRVKGQSEAESVATLADITRLLYQPQVVYPHLWQAGDLLVADNHTLLHGRRAFRAGASRHLQRIHVL